MMTSPSFHFCPVCGGDEDMDADEMWALRKRLMELTKGDA